MVRNNVQITLAIALQIACVLNHVLHQAQFHVKIHHYPLLKTWVLCEHSSLE